MRAQQHANDQGDLHQNMKIDEHGGLTLIIVSFSIERLRSGRFLPPGWRPLTGSERGDHRLAMV